jgi:lysophospholipase L1-like esterase
MPAVNVGLLDGQLAWRQHDAGHTDGPNWTWFLPWADRQFRRTPPADRPVARIDRNSQIAHEQLLAKAKAGGTDVYFEGDSITRRWGATDYPQMLANWKENFFGWNAADFGWGADTTQNILWRLENGELDGVNPRAIVLLAGTNNIGGGAAAEDVARGIEEIVRVMQAKAPAAKIVLTAVFPRYDRPLYAATIERVNAELAKFAEANKVRWLDVNRKMTEETLNPDRLHPNVKGYQVWADALKPVLTEILGPPAKADHAPAPTGDPSAKR